MHYYYYIHKHIMVQNEVHSELIIYYVIELRHLDVHPFEIEQCIIMYPSSERLLNQMWLHRFDIIVRCATRALFRLVWPLISSLVMSMMISGGLVVCPAEIVSAASSHPPVRPCIAQTRAYFVYEAARNHHRHHK